MRALCLVLLLLSGCAGAQRDDPGSGQVHVHGVYSSFGGLVNVR